MGALQNITGFQAALGHGGRANKFRVAFTAPSALTGVSFGESAYYLCKSASFPSKSIGTVEVHKQGRKLNLPGDTSYPGTYEITFYMTEGHTLRQDFLTWMNAIDGFEDNTHVTDPSLLMTDSLSIYQLKSISGDSALALDTASYTLYKVFPSSVGEVSVDDESANSVLKFTVTFTYTYWK